MKTEPILATEKLQIGVIHDPGWTLPPEYRVVYVILVLMLGPPSKRFMKTAKGTFSLN